MKAHYVFVGKCPYEIRNINYKPIKMQIIIACDDTYLHSQNLEGRGRGITLSFRVRPHLKKKKKPKRQKHPEKGILCKVLATLQYHGGKSLGPASWSDRPLYPL